MKVYIVDEVHMLTPEAFNALLKMLEEPPPHVVFVLATTEPHKVLPTILSRCQRFDFRRPTIAEIVSVLVDVAERESIEVGENTLSVIARAAGGSFRDALGTLDQLSSYCAGVVTLQDALTILGVAQQDLLFELVDIVDDADTREALLFVERLTQTRHRPQPVHEGPAEPPARPLRGAAHGRSAGQHRQQPGAPGPAARARPTACRPPR